MRRQMLERDRDGFTVAMHAARAKHIVVLETVLAEIVHSDVRYGGGEVVMGAQACRSFCLR